jgi:hypothetical protein
MLERGAQRQTADAAKSVDTQLDGHGESLGRKVTKQLRNRI